MHATDYNDRRLYDGNDIPVFCEDAVHHLPVHGDQKRKENNRVHLYLFTFLALITKLNQANTRLDVEKHY